MPALILLFLFFPHFLTPIFTCSGKASSFTIFFFLFLLKVHSLLGISVMGTVYFPKKFEVLRETDIAAMLFAFLKA